MNDARNTTPTLWQRAADPASATARRPKATLTGRATPKPQAGKPQRRARGPGFGKRLALLFSGLTGQKSTEALLAEAGAPTRKPAARKPQPLKRPYKDVMAERQLAAAKARAGQTVTRVPRTEPPQPELPLAERLDQLIMMGKPIPTAEWKRKTLPHEPADLLESRDAGRLRGRKLKPVNLQQRVFAAARQR